MSVAHINANASLSLFVVNHKQEGNNQINANKGSVFSALIVEQKASLFYLQTAENQKFSLPSESVVGNVGDEVFFEVMQNDKNGLKLAQVFENKHQTKSFSKALQKQCSMKELQNLMKKTDFIEETDQKTWETEREKNQQKTAQAIAKIKRQVAFVSNNTNRAAVASLVASGVSLSKISLNMLNSVAEKIEFKEDTSIISAEKISQKLHTYFQNKNINIPDENQQKAAHLLVENHIPLTDKNMETVKHCQEQFQSLSQLTDKDILRFLQTEKPPTLENVYVAKFQSKNMRESTSDYTWEQLRPQVDKTFDRLLLPKTEENFKWARQLLANQLPINKVNMEAKEAFSSLHESENANALFYQVAQNIKNNKNPSDVPLFGNQKLHSQVLQLKEQYGTLLRQLPTIGKSHVSVLVGRNLPVTLFHLQQVSQEPTTDTIAQQNVANNAELGQKTDDSTKQLLELQLRMTHEAAMRLAGKNIDIRNQTLERAIETLKADQKTQFANLLGSENAQHVQTMSTVFDNVKAFSAMTFNVFAQIAKKQIAYTIVSVGDALLTEKQTKQYNENATVPNIKYGDSFQKISNQFAPLLQSLGIEPTKSNIKAAKILSQNNMNITSDALLQIKHIDVQLQTVKDKLHPLIAANMLKENLDLAHMPIEGVISYIEAFQDTFGMTKQEQLAQHIFQMDKNKNISQEHRKKILDVYKMLKTIIKHDAKAIGLTLSTENQMTLGGLFSAAKYVEQKGKQSIFASTKQNTLNKNIYENQTDYYKGLIRSIVDVSQPQNVSNHLPNQDISLEKWLEELTQDQTEVKTEEISTFLNELEGLPATDPFALHMLTLTNQPQSLQNIKLMEKLMQEPLFLAQLLGELQKQCQADEDAKGFYDELVDNFPTTDQLDLNDMEAPTLLWQKLQNMLQTREQLETNPKLLHTLEIAQKAIGLQMGMLNQQQTQSKNQIPLVFGRKLTDVYMYVANKEMDVANQTTVMALDTAFGSVKVQMQTTNNQVDITLSTKSTKAKAFLQAQESLLHKLVEPSGFSLGKVAFLDEQS